MLSRSYMCGVGTEDVKVLWLDSLIPLELTSHSLGTPHIWELTNKLERRVSGPPANLTIGQSIISFYTMAIHLTSALHTTT